jgi:hypothetical protein
MTRLAYHRCMETKARDDEAFGAPRRLSHEAARLEQLLYWSGKSIPERLAAGAELTRRLNRMRGIDTDEYETDFTPSRVRRSQS